MPSHTEIFWTLFYTPFCLYLYYMPNSKTKGHIRTLYLTNDCFTIKDIYFLG